MAAPNIQPVLTEIIDTLKEQKEATEKNIELIKSRNKILESIVPVDKDLLIKEKETLTGIAGAMRGVSDSVNAVGNSLVSSAESFVTDIFGPGLGGLVNTLTIGFFTRWRDKKKEEKRQAVILKEQNEKADELYDKRLGVMAASVGSLKQQAKDGDEQAQTQLDQDVDFQTEEQQQKTKELVEVSRPLKSAAANDDDDAQLGQIEKNPPKIRNKKIVKLTGHTYACNSLNV